MKVFLIIILYFLAGTLSYWVFHRLNWMHDDYTHLWCGVFWPITIPVFLLYVVFLAILGGMRWLGDQLDRLTDKIW